MTGTTPIHRKQRPRGGLRHTDNPDGSRTYVLDLSSIAAGNGGSNAGVAVNLSVSAD